MAQEIIKPTEISPHIQEGAGNGLHPVTLFAEEQTVGRMRLVWNQRRFLLRLTGIGLAIAAAVAFLIPNRYQSTTRLMPPDQTSSGMAMLSAALGGRGAGESGPGSGSGLNLGALAGDVLGMRTSTDLFIGILQSRTVEDDLIDKFNLRKVYWDRYYKDAREDLERRTDITSDRKSGIIAIRVADRDPKRAAAMGTEYVQELDRLVAQVNTTSAHRERVFLEGRLSEVQKDLETAEKQFSAFASKNVALDIPTQGKAMIEAAAALKGQLIVAQTELQGMRQIYSDNNVRVRGLQARVNELQRQVQQLGGKYDSSSDSTIQADQALFPSIRKLPVLGVSYADLYRNTKVQEAVFETLTQEYEMAKVQEAKETPSVKLIDPPDVPEKHSSPHRLLLILGGTCLFLVGGIGWIFGHERWGQIDAGDPGKVLVLEVASSLKAHLPSVSTNGHSPGPGHDQPAPSDSNGSHPDR